MNDSVNNKPVRVLLVDDDADFVKSMTGILELSSYVVDSAGSAPEAMAKLTEFGPDVALVDVRLGLDDGLDLVGALKEVCPELICVTVTAYADTDTAIAALQKGVYDYLRKPFEANDLLAVLNRCADRKRILNEKKAAEKARQESEIRFKLAFDTSPDAIILAYPGGEIIDVNSGFEQMTGYRRENVIGRNSQEVGLWKSPASRAQMLELIEQGGSIDNYEAEFRIFDGRIRIGLLSGRLVELEGEKVGLFVVRDIHDVRLKERAIMESEERFRSLVSHLPGAVYRCSKDKDWTMHYISSPVLDISGYPPTDFVNNSIRSYASIVFPDDLDMVAKAVDDAVSARKIFSIEYRIVHADGTVRWVHEKGQGVFGSSGDLLYLDGAIFDITENKQAVAALAASENRLKEIYEEYNTVLEGIPDAIFLINKDLKVVWANQGASAHFGLAQEQLEGMLCSEIWNCTASNCLGCLKKVFNDGGPSETVQSTPNGRTWGVKVFPIKSDSGEVENVVQIASDMTEKMRLRDQASRSAHLAALGELAAGVAHEINNPTGTILLNMPMLKDAFSELMPLLHKHEADWKDKKIAGLPYQTFCQEIPVVVGELTECAYRIKRIVEELKDFSRPAGGEFVKVDLNEVVKKSISLVRNALKNATDNFTETYCAIPVLVEGSSQRLEQVLVNLLLNACQSLPGRSHGIQIETTVNAQNDCLIIVRDEGRGIAPELISQITDPFFTTRRDSGGTGLGLSVSSRIIDEHKGMMSFESELGKGTVVTICFPCSEERS